MVNTDFPGDQELFDRLTFSRGKDTGNSNIAKIKDIISSMPIITLAILLSTAQPASSQEVIGEDCVVSILQDNEQNKPDINECDLTTPSVFKTEYGVPYYKDILAADGDKVEDEDGFSMFVDDFGPVLMHLAKNNALNGGDIIAGMNLYDVRGMREIDLEKYADLYDKFINSYRNPELNIMAVLEENGYPYHGLI